VNSNPVLSRLLALDQWVMAPSERAALEGLLVLLRPSLSIEVGTGACGSLESISTHSATVHTFDLRRYEDVAPERFANVTFHIGDSHELLPALLRQLAEAGTNVDFALVDGDHTAAGVLRDVEDLLSSPSVEESVIVLHDTLNERVRTGLEAIDYGKFDKVSFVDLDFLPGCVFREGPWKGEAWCGLGLIATGQALEDRRWPAKYAMPEITARFRDPPASASSPEAFGLARAAPLEQEIWDLKQLVSGMERSWSWRMTRPLRRAKRHARDVLGRE